MLSTHDSGIAARCERLVGLGRRPDRERTSNLTDGEDPAADRHPRACAQSRPRPPGRLRPWCPRRARAERRGPAEPGATAGGPCSAIALGDLSGGSASVAGLDHDPDQRLGPAGPQQHPTGPRPAPPRPARPRPRTAGEAADRRPVRHPYVDQHLGSRHTGARSARLRPVSAIRAITCSAGQHAVAGGGVGGQDDVPALLAAERSPPARSASTTYRSPTAVSSSVMPLARWPVAGRGCSSRSRPTCPRQRAGLAHGDREHRHDLSPSTT